MEIRLRALTQEDSEKILVLRASSRVKFLHKIENTLEQQKQWIQDHSETELNYAIESNNGNFIGTISIYKIAKNSAEVGRFVLERNYLNTGYGIMALLAVYEICFDRMNLDYVFGTVAEKNKLMLNFHTYFGMDIRLGPRLLDNINDSMQEIIEIVLTKQSYYVISHPKLIQFLSKYGF